MVGGKCHLPLIVKISAADDPHHRGAGRNLCFTGTSVNQNQARTGVASTDTSFKDSRCGGKHQNPRPPYGGGRHQMRLVRPNW